MSACLLSAQHCKKIRECDVDKNLWYVLRKNNRKWLRIRSGPCPSSSKSLETLFLPEEIPKPAFDIPNHSAWTYKSFCNGEFPRPCDMDDKRARALCLYFERARCIEKLLRDAKEDIDIPLADITVAFLWEK